MNRIIGHAAVIAFAASAAWAEDSGQKCERFAKTIVKEG